MPKTTQLSNFYTVTRSGRQISSRKAKETSQVSLERETNSLITSSTNATRSRKVTTRKCKESSLISIQNETTTSSTDAPKQLGDVSCSTFDIKSSKIKKQTKIGLNTDKKNQSDKIEDYLVPLNETNVKKLNDVVIEVAASNNTPSLPAEILSPRKRTKQPKKIIEDANEVLRSPAKVAKISEVIEKKELPEVAKKPENSNKVMNIEKESALSPCKTNLIVEEPAVIKSESVTSRKAKSKPRFITEKESEALLERIKAKAEKKAAHEKYAYLVKKSKFDEVTDTNEREPITLTKTEPKPNIPTFSPNKSLPLPYNYNVLFEHFKSCETVVSMLHNRNEICTFDKVKSSVEKIVRKEFLEEHIDQIVNIYPNCYFLRYDKQIDPLTKKLTGNYTLVLNPNLRDDCTKLGFESPTKGHIVFTGTRLLQRKQEFHRRLLFSAYCAHRQFLFGLGLSPEDIPPDNELKRWHPKFPLDSVKIEISASKLPLSPAKLERRLTSAREAVQVFRARALFRQAAVTENIAALSEIKPSSSCSIPQTQNNLPNKNNPMLDLLENMEAKSSSIQMSIPVLAPSPIKSSNSANLVGISQTLLMKIKAKEQQRKLLVMTKALISADRDALLSRLPVLAPQLWCALRAQNGKPISLANIAKQIASSCATGSLEIDSAVEHIKTLVDFSPKGWCEILPWTIPHIKLLDANLPMKKVLEELEKRIQQERSPK